MTGKQVDRGCLYIYPSFVRYVLLWDERSAIWYR